MKEFELTCKLGLEPSEAEMKAAAARAMGLSPKADIHCRIVRRSIDARTDVIYRYRIQSFRPDEEEDTYVIPEYK